jgi:hypothetical protein
MPVPMQIAIIVLAFGIGLLVVTLLMKHLNEPAQTAPAAYGPGN